MWTMQLATPGQRQGGILACGEVWRIGEWEVPLNGYCMGFFDHCFVLNSRRVREAQEEGSSCLREKAVQIQQGLHGGLGGIPGQASSQACGGQSSQHAHGLPEAQPLPL